MRLGSSPLARGTGRPPRISGRCARFIPAGAGNSRPYAALFCVRAVHPRWRGEQGIVKKHYRAHVGSSPLARGTVPIVAMANCPGRFIPAGAGNSFCHGIFPDAESVHPRWRGEQVFSGRRRFLGVGSSPLARGTGCPMKCPRRTQRFIPAGAGNSRCPVRTARPFSVHPRWRGEQVRFAALPADHHGSSPLARGTAARPGHLAAVCRFIPAGAGNSSTR